MDLLPFSFNYVIMKQYESSACLVSGNIFAHLNFNVTDVFFQHGEPKLLVAELVPSEIP
jgi:hypothetical protein